MLIRARKTVLRSGRHTRKIFLMETNILVKVARFSFHSVAYSFIPFHWPSRGVGSGGFRHRVVNAANCSTGVFQPLGKRRVFFGNSAECQGREISCVFASPMLCYTEMIVRISII